MLAVSRADKQKIAWINRPYTSDVEPFGDGNDTNIDKVQPGISIRLNQ